MDLSHPVTVESLVTKSIVAAGVHYVGERRCRRPAFSDSCAREVDRLKVLMVSVVVSIRMRKMFAEGRERYLNARDAEQAVRERQASRNF